MGAAIDALKDTFGVVQRNPIILLIAAVAQFAMAVGGAIVSIIPIVGPIVSAVVITPTILGGYYYAADRAHQENAVGFDDFTQGMSENWKSLAGAYALLVTLAIAFMFIITMIAMLMGVSALSAADPGSGAPTAALGGSMMLLFPITIVGFFLIGMVVQFVDVAVVVGDQNATGAFSKAWELFREDPLSVFGYSILRTALPMAVFIIPMSFMGIGGGLAAGGGASEMGAVFIVAVLLMLLLYPVIFSLMMTYHAVYFRYREFGR